MTAPMKLENRVAAVTGAASGIGRAIAVSLARRGCHLALADIDEGGLAGTKRAASGGSASISLHKLDVADRAAVAAFPNAVVSAHGRVDLLVNNAGVALGGTFEQVSEEDFEWLFDINFWGVVRMTRAFLPHLKASDDARIVNLSSVYGLVAPPGQTAYAASKFAVRGFSYALMQELDASPIGVTVVHPGGVATAIADRARSPKSAKPEEIAAALARAKSMLKLAPEIAGETIVKGIERRRRRVLVGGDAKTVALIERLAPISNLAILARLVRP
jgi:NAD(P)-dependent dehydrogenase (short-subunit alcohol dehydrogenase family)